MTNDETIQTVAQRRQEYREAMIEDILTIAREMMRKDGVAALSFNAIARRLGMKPPSLYTYFDSKNDIYDELFRRGFEEFGRRMAEGAPGDRTLRENLTNVMHTYLQFAQENPDLYQLMFQRPVPEFEPSKRSMAVSLEELEVARQKFAGVVNQSDLDPGMPIDQALDLFISLLHGMTEQHLANHPHLPASQGRFGKLIPQAVQLLLDAWQRD